MGHPSAPGGARKHGLPVQHALGGMHPGVRAQDARQVTGHGHSLDHDGNRADRTWRARRGQSAQPGRRSLLRGRFDLGNQLPGGGQVQAGRRVVGLRRQAGRYQLDLPPPGELPLSATATADPVLATTPITIVPVTL